MRAGDFEILGTNSIICRALECQEDAGQSTEHAAICARQADTSTIKLKNTVRLKRGEKAFLLKV